MNFIIKKGGKRAAIGEIREAGGRKYIKTTQGWKYYGRGSGTKAKTHQRVYGSGKETLNEYERYIQAGLTSREYHRDMHLREEAIKKMEAKKFASIPQSERHDDGTHSEVNDYGAKIWKNSEGLIHRDDDKPAVIRTDGTAVWYKNGRIHREGDMPAYEGPDRMEWYKNGVHHREGDRPAVRTKEGLRKYYKNGSLHRGGERPAIMPGGAKLNQPTIGMEWWSNGKRNYQRDAELRKKLGYNR